MSLFKTYSNRKKLFLTFVENLFPLICIFIGRIGLDHKVRPILDSLISNALLDQKNVEDLSLVRVGQSDISAVQKPRNDKSNRNPMEKTSKSFINKHSYHATVYESIENAFCFSSERKEGDFVAQVVALDVKNNSLSLSLGLSSFIQV